MPGRVRWDRDAERWVIEGDTPEDEARAAQFAARIGRIYRTPVTDDEIRNVAYREGLSVDSGTARMIAAQEKHAALGSPHGEVRVRYSDPWWLRPLGWLVRRWDRKTLG